MSSWLAVSEDDDTDEDFAPGQPRALPRGRQRGHVVATDGADEEGIGRAATVALRMSWREKQLGGTRPLDHRAHWPNKG